MYCQMSCLTGRGFAEVKRLKQKFKIGPYSWTVRNILIKFCIHIDIDNI